MSRYICDACKKGINSNRYHCHECIDFDLCENCYQLKSCIASHTFKHKIQKITNSSDGDLKPNTTYNCDVCKVKINNDEPRYHCLQCPDYDLCVNCQKTQNDISPHSNIHPMSYFIKSSPKNFTPNSGFFFLILFFIHFLLDNDKCLICFGDPINPIKFKYCEKTFCMEHILKWVCKSNGTCPHCRNHFDFEASDHFDVGNRVPSGNHFFESNVMY
jgi:hypothetical protein